MKFDLIDKKFNRLYVIEKIGKIKEHSKDIYWKCLCDCGNITSLRTTDLTKNKIKSCGCLQKEFCKKAFSKENKFVELEDFYEGYTTSGKVFYFDKDDYDKVSKFMWWADSKNYIITEGIKIHQLIMGKPKKGYEIDHIDLNPLNNRKSNLRIITKSENNMNKKCKSIFNIKGVYWDIRKGNWCVDFRNEKNRIIKSFKNIKDAIEKRVELEKEYFGEYRYIWENDIKWEELLEYEKQVKMERINENNKYKCI